MIDGRYDIIIVGTGAGGGTIAAALAPSGKRILILERGGFIPRERENWDSRAVFEEKRYQARESWLDESGAAFEPYTHYCVGGNTKFYGAALLRMREFDFGEVRHAGGVSPAWPISYADLEPYYTRAERMYSVRGARGLDPFDPPASAPYPLPPLEPEARMKEIMDDFSALGARPFPIPLALREHPGRAAPPVGLGAFDGYPDPTETKADAHVVGVRAALALPNVELLTNTLVESLKTDALGREVSEVVVTRAGEQLRFAADVVIVACGAINTAALLLRSASDRHPHGLANSSGLIGRNYMCHQNGCFVAVLDEPNASKFQKHFGITDYYRAGEHGPYPLGTIQLMGKPDRGTLEWLGAGRVPGATVEDIMTRTVDFFLTAEDLPDPANRVTIEPDGRIRITCRRNNAAAYDGLQARLSALLERMQERRGRAAPVFLASRLGVGGVSHQCGTARFGVDPATSVLDVDCKAHDLDNLYVADTSFFPSSSAVNPSLTAMANALRVAERILDRLGAAAPVAQGAGA